MTSTDTAPAGYIATDEDLCSGAIYGIGTTPEEALADAREDSRQPEGVFGLCAATSRLIEAVRENGGGPGDVRWRYDGVTPLPTDPDDVFRSSVADLEG